MYYVYILTNKTKSTFYIGVTNNLAKRIYEHNNAFVKGFAEKYNLKLLVFYEQYDYIADALKREKQLKNWHREWKINLIKSVNPNFEDLINTIY